MYCSTVFLDVTQTFDCVWYSGPLFKLKIILPPPYFLFLKLYLENRHFATRMGTKTSELSPILDGVNFVLVILIRII